MLRSLVGSELCLRDRGKSMERRGSNPRFTPEFRLQRGRQGADSAAMTLRIWCEFEFPPSGATILL
jgi:hypothetical protein